ncbi:palindromic element RPE1 domain-containing protein [Candidatus Tisiphia endosymbiont of Empis tessellata]|uniref:palindromic element RPE1 domain-containing protein n=1 Tax=Candidatus Tisiphia endosymbiont of Empis tessellata TaxID=3066259 RepID=UPI00313D08F2
MAKNKQQAVYLDCHATLWLAMTIICFYNRPFSKLAYAEGFEGDASPQTTAYSNSVTDSSAASTCKSPAEVEFRKRSNLVFSVIS